MQIEYPIFVKDRDGWVSIVHRSVNELEIIDVENGEFVGCWDRNGIPLQLNLKKDRNNQEIRVEIAFDNVQLDQLKEAIVSYAKLARPKVSFVYSGPKDDIVALYRAVEEHINAGQLRNKLKKFFKKT